MRVPFTHAHISTSCDIIIIIDATSLFQGDNIIVLGGVEDSNDQISPSSPTESTSDSKKHI